MPRFPTSTVFRSRADQIAEHLRQSIAANRWTRRLPPERDLARELGVGLRSLRAALVGLQKEGWILSRTQAGTMINPRKTGAVREERSIGLVYAQHVKMLQGNSLLILEEVRPLFAARNVGLEIHRAPYLEGDRVSVRFERMMREHQHDSWTLISPTVSIQKWCRRHRVPAIVFGARHEATGLPCAEFDYHAVGYHAVGEMLRLGHRHLALILPAMLKGEDLSVRAGFEAASREIGAGRAVISVLQHDSTVRGVCRLADRLLAQRPRPTAWLICRQEHFLTFFTHLMHQRISIPEEVSLICRDGHAYIGDLVPEPTRYTPNLALLVRHYARLALRHLDGQATPGEKVTLIPDFIPGATLGAAPE